jgi:soluble lytic murein transglycosylase-like protein
VGPPAGVTDRLGRAVGLPGRHAARRHGVDAPVFAALVWSESAFRPTVVSHAGAIGLAQLMPGTARGSGCRPVGPEQNLDGGARYLAMQVGRFGSLELGLAAYNAGPGNVIKYGGIPPFAETQIYVVRVIDRCQQIAS